MSRIFRDLEDVFHVLHDAQPGDSDAKPPIAGLTIKKIRALSEHEQGEFYLKFLRWGVEHQIPEPANAPIRHRSNFRL
jgi:hypothetical protein